MIKLHQHFCIRLILIQCVILLNIYPVFAQKSKTAKLLNILDSAKVYLEQYNFTKALEKTNEFLISAKQNTTDNQIGIAHLIRSEILEKQGKLSEAIEENENIILKDLKITNDSIIAHAYINIGKIYGDRGYLSKGINNILKGLKIAEKINSLDLLAIAYSRIGIIYFNAKNYKQSEQYVLKSIEIRKKLKDKKGLARAYGNIAMIEELQLNDKEVVKNYINAKNACEELNDFECITKAYNNIGVYFDNKKKYNLALSYYLSSYDYAKRHSFTSLEGITAYNIAKVYSHINKPDSLKYYADIAYQISKKTQSLEDISGSYQLYYIYYEMKNNFKKALEYYINYSKYNDSVLVYSNNRAVEIEKEKYELEKIESKLKVENEKKNAELKIKFKEQQFLKNLFILTTVSILLIMIITFRALRKIRLSKELSEIQNEKLKEAVREKDALNSIVAHDLKTPVTQMSGLLQILKFKTKGDHDLNEITSNMEKAILHGDTLISELLQVNEIENQKDTNLYNINLAKLVSNSLEHFKIELRKKQLTLINNIQEKDNVLSREEWASKIINNFISNAIKFSPYNKIIEIYSKEISEKEIMICVSDQGPGISEDEQKLLFKKFQKLSNKPTAGESSTGLGLYISKLVAEKSNAKLNYESQIGKGSIFMATFKKA